MKKITMRILCSAGLLLIIFSVSMASAAEYQRGAMMRVAQLYISPDPTSAKLGDIERGREVIILETSRHWLGKHSIAPPISDGKSRNRMFPRVPQQKSERLSCAKAWTKSL